MMMLAMVITVVSVIGLMVLGDSVGTYCKENGLYMK